MKRTPAFLLVTGLVLILGSPFAGTCFTALGMMGAFQGPASSAGNLAGNLGAALEATVIGFLLAGLGVGLVAAAGLFHLADRHRPGRPA
jgi:hypothetical protein